MRYGPAMRTSRSFVPTLKETPADAQVTSHQLLVRAGFIRQLAAGIYSILPLAQRSLLKITGIIREEMDAIGGQEFYLPAPSCAATGSSRRPGTRSRPSSATSPGPRAACCACASSP